jgi:hypothetical protein
MNIAIAVLVESDDGDAGGEASHRFAEIGCVEGHGPRAKKESSH